MKLYVINGEAYTWDYIHNELGYTTTATESFQYMSARPETWGEYIGTGYGDRYGDVGDLEYYKYFVEGLTGWFADIDALALDGDAYPAQCDGGPTFTDGNTSSPSATYEFEGVSKYLIRDAVVLGWKSESDLAEQGWTIEVDANYELLFFDTSTGKVSYGVESLNEMVFTETGYFTIEDDADVVFVQPSQYPVVSQDTYAPASIPETIVDGGAVNTVYQYYSSKLYIAMAAVNDTTYGVIPESVGWDMSTTPGDISITNNTGASKAIFQLQIYSMDATDAEVVEIKNQSDEHFYAFKWTSNGTPYWYVVAWTHFWTDDLEAEGWEEVPAVELPTVSVSGWWIQFQYGQTMLFEPGTTTGCYRSTGDRMLYEADKSYAIIQIRNQNNQLYGSNTYLQIYSDTGDMSVRNVSDKTFRSIQCLHAICDTVVDVVTVFDASNNPFNTFKYTVGGIDYYYVLEPDGWGIKQTDWTDDLSSIGYSLTPNYLKGYINSSKTDSWISYGSSKSLYNESGSFIIGDSSKTYTLMGVYKSNGDSVSYTSVSFYPYSNRLMFDWNDSSTYIAYVEYTVS